MMRRLFPWAAIFAAMLVVCASPLAAQTAKARKTAAASGQQTTGGSVPLRVGLVISDATRAYKTMIFLTRIEFGRRLADKAVGIFKETFTSVQELSGLPAPGGYGDLNLVVAVEVAEAHTQSPFLSQPNYYLTARFTVWNASGQQILQLQEYATDKSNSPAAGPDSVGEAVVRKFIQDLVLNPAVRNLLAPAPAPAAPVAAAAQPERDDSAALASAGLDVPPPPPWAQPGSNRRP
jgi:hypothetical protein